MSRQNKFLLIIICILTVYVTGCGNFQKYTKTETDKFTINAAGKTNLSIDNIGGDITIIKSNDSIIKITAVKEVKVRKKDLDKPFNEVRINLDTLTDNIKIDYDTEDFDDGPFSRMRRPEITYTISVPSFIDLKIDNNFGNIFLNKIDNDITLEVGHGEINLEHVTGSIKADMASGDITGTIDSTRGLIFDIAHGDVRLTFGAGVNARINAKWAHGDFSYDGLSFANINEDKESFRGILGTGRFDIKIEMASGKIKLYGDGTSMTL